jgi:hypothetical protein
MSAAVQARRAEQAAARLEALKIEEARLAETERFEAEILSRKIEEAKRNAVAKRGQRAAQKLAASSSSSSSSSSSVVPSVVPSAKGGPKAAAPRGSKAAAPRGSRGSKASAVAEGEEEEEEVQNVNLAAHKDYLKSKYPEVIVNLLVSDTPGDFKVKWPDSPNLTLDQWNAVRQIFINSGEWVRKDQNVYLNEIRERALLFIVTLTDEDINTNFNEVGDFLKQLRNLWIGRMCDCRDTYLLNNYSEEDENMDKYLDQYDTDEDVLVRKGGRGANWDFELNDYIKLELKFSSIGKSGVDKLAQFVALILEGLKALGIFGASYLDFFYDGGYLQSMVDMFNTMTSAGAGLTIPDKALWIKAAAATSPPANSRPDVIQFFNTMRSINKDKNNKDFLEAKKTLVNKSFSEFIDSRMDYLNGPGRANLQELLNNQIQKFFCIFTGDGDQVTCEVDQMPPFTIVGIQHEENSHTFLILTSDNDDYNILVGLSWGNGGAGCNNPRAMFSLVRKAGRGGGFGDDDDEDDNDEIKKKEEKIAYEIFDKENTVAVLVTRPPISRKYIRETAKKRLEDLKGVPTEMVSRSGKRIENKDDNWTTLPDGNWVKKTDLTEGGRRKFSNTIYSKTKNVKSKKNKKNKFTKKYRNTSRNKMSKNRKNRNKMSKNRK